MTDVHVSIITNNHDGRQRHTLDTGLPRPFSSIQVHPHFTQLPRALHLFEAWKDVVTLWVEEAWRTPARSAILLFPLPGPWPPQSSSPLYFLSVRHTSLLPFSVSLLTAFSTSRTLSAQNQVCSPQGGHAEELRPLGVKREILRSRSHETPATGIDRMPTLTPALMWLWPPYLKVLLPI